MCYLESKGLSRRLCLVWNPKKGIFNAYQSFACIVLEGRVKGWAQLVKLVNRYGPYINMKDFLNQIMEDGWLSDPTVILGGDLNLTISDR